MRFGWLLASSLLVAGLIACIGSGHSPTVVVGDADADVAAEEASDDSGDLDVNPGDVATSDRCTLSDGVTDPVAICVQAKVLDNEIQYAHMKGQGIASTWSSAAPYSAGSEHTWQNDLGLAGALGAYQCSALVYGNNRSTAAFDAVIEDLGPVLLEELSTSPPVGYDGETYFRLRWAQAAYFYVDNLTAQSIATLAEAYGQALIAQAHVVPAAGGDAGSPGGVVVGTLGAGGSIAYAPVQTVMAAAALLDMASLHWNDPDAGTGPASWAATAEQVLAYVGARGRDPVTGLYYQSLVTSSDAAHDALGSATPTNDTELTEDQAWIVLGLMRAQDLLTKLTADFGDGGIEGGTLDGAALLAQPYALAANELVTALTNDKLFDGSANPPTPPTPGAFMEALVSSTGAVDTNKATTGNAILLGGFHRVAYGLGSALGYELGELRAALTQLQPAATSLLTVVTLGGIPVQQAYLRASSQDWALAVAFSPDGGTGAPELGATDYRTDAVVAAIEGLTQLWHGPASDASCAP